MSLVAVLGLVAAGCVTNPPPFDPEPLECQPGTFSATGDEPCTPAPAGSYVATVGATEATACLPGTYQNQEGQTSCLFAPIGTYVSTAGATAAADCPDGTTTDTTGATSQDDCVPVIDCDAAPSPGVNLSGCDLAFRPFIGADLTDADLSDATLASALL